MWPKMRRRAGRRSRDSAAHWGSSSKLVGSKREGANDKAQNGRMATNKGRSGRGAGHNRVASASFALPPPSWRRPQAAASPRSPQGLALRSPHSPPCSLSPLAHATSAPAAASLSASSRFPPSNRTKLSPME